MLRLGFEESRQPGPFVGNLLSPCGLCTVIEDPGISHFATGRTERLVQAIPIAIYKGFVVFQKRKHTPKGDPVASYGGFVVSQWT